MSHPGFDTPVPKQATPPELATLFAALDRLEETIDVENAAFETRAPLDLVEINRRKSRSLLELSRAARGLPAELDGAARARLSRLRGKLERNQYVVSVRISAAREVGAILDQVLRAAESDGTYGAHPPRDGMAR